MIVLTIENSMVENSNYRAFISSIISSASSNNFVDVLHRTKELYLFYASKEPMMLCNVINEILFKLYDSLDIPFSDYLVMTIYCDYVLQEESVNKAIEESKLQINIDYARLGFYEEKYTSALLISNVILDQVDLKKTTLDLPNFFKIFDLILGEKRVDIKLL